MFTKYIHDKLNEQLFPKQACLWIENTILVSFDIKLILEYQKQHMNGRLAEAVWSSLINLISNDTSVVVPLCYMLCRMYMVFSNMVN